jgi:hypothetical protein
MIHCCLEELLVDISSSPFGSWRKEKKSTQDEPWDLVFKVPGCSPPS